MKPVRTRDGQVVMQLQRELDGLTEERLEKSLQELEKQSSQKISDLVKELEETLVS